MPGIDEFLLAAFSAAASGTAAKAAQPDQPDVGGGLPSGAAAALGPGTGFELPIPTVRTAEQTIASPGAALDLSPIDAIVEQVAQMLAAQGLPPTVPLEPTGSQKETPKQPSIGEVLMASPESIVAMAQLLGIGNRQRVGDRPAPVPGGTVGNVVPGFGLPQTSSIGQLLAQIPRL